MALAVPICCMSLNLCLPVDSLVNLFVFICLSVSICHKGPLLCVYGTTQRTSHGEGMKDNLQKSARVLEGIKSLISTDQHNKEYYKHFLIEQYLYVTFNICGGYSFLR